MNLTKKCFVVIVEIEEKVVPYTDQEDKLIWRKSIYANITIFDV